MLHSCFWNTIMRLCRPPQHGERLFMHPQDEDQTSGSELGSEGPKHTKP